MKLLTRMIQIVFVIAILLAPGANLPPAFAQPDVVPYNPPLPAGGDELFNTKLSLGPNDWLYAEAVAPNGDIYVGGDSDTIGGVSTGLVARWGASDHQWHTLGNDITWGRIQALAISGNYLYVGGYFESVNGSSILTNGIARWNMATNTWSTVGGPGITPSSGYVYSLAVDGSGNVYAGGNFATIDGVSALNIAKWNGATWSAMGSGLGIVNNKVYALLWRGTTLYAGGSFANFNNIAYWNTADASPSWKTLGGGANQQVIALAADSNALYAGGSFTQVTNGSTNITVGYVAQYLWAAGGSWQDMNLGVCCADVDALAVGPDGLVYAGGRFNKTGDASATTVSNLAYWQGGAWHPLYPASSFSQGANGNIYGLVFSGQDMWVVGGFGEAGDYSANNVASFNLTSKQWFTPGGNAPNGTIHAVVVNYPYIYYGGAFDFAGGIQTGGVARYDVVTNTWSALGAGVSGCNGFCGVAQVNALALAGPYLYVGGNFTSAGGVSVNGLARYDTTTNAWSDVGGGLTNCPSFLCSTSVNALAYYGSTLYVGGYFQTAGTITVNNIAAWNGSSWSALYDSSISQLGVNNEVDALAVNPSTAEIYVGGYFTTPGSKIAIWNGSNWNTIGTATFNGNVSAIDIFGGTLLTGANVFIGGSFTTAGGSPANYLARLAGSTWLPVSSSTLDGPVNALADNGSQMAVGGDFRYAGALSVEHVAYLSNNQWFALGRGVTGTTYSLTTTVDALAISRGYIFVGGTFRSAGPNRPGTSSPYPSDNIAIWGGYRSYLPQVKR